MYEIQVEYDQYYILTCIEDNNTFFGSTQTVIVIVSSQVPTVIIIVSLDTTWTKADSLNPLTGPLFVNEGTTLTVMAEATVNLNNYDVLMDDTLRTIGSNNNCSNNC